MKPVIGLLQSEHDGSVRVPMARSRCLHHPAKASSVDCQESDEIFYLGRSPSTFSAQLAQISGLARRA
jgi:hypothetical protein